MRVGTANISPAQENYLAGARQDADGSELGHLFYRVIRDDDIIAEREDLHPDWLEIFQLKKKLLRQHMPKPIFAEILKAFEPLQALDEHLSKIDPDSLRIAFLLGAGASKPNPSNIPTVKELLPQLLERARRLDRDDVTNLADFCENQKIDNIEDLLTAAQLATFCSRNPTVLGLMNHLLYRGSVERSPDDFAFRSSNPMQTRNLRRFRTPAADLSSVAFLQDTLQVLFGLLSSTMLPAKPNPAHESIADYAKKNSSSAIVTTNYDCCMDLALGELNKDFSYLIEFTNKREDISRQQKSTRLIKLHGSLNWYYCETCQTIQMVDIKQMVELYLEDRAPFPIIGICKSCGGQRRGLLVPPLAMKFDVAPPLTPLLGEARSVFEGADLIVVVGFSFAEADIYISRMLSKSMQISSRQRIIIADPDYEIVAKVQRKFKASIPNFDVARIIRMAGDSADLLPRFLSGRLRKGLEDGSGRPKEAERLAVVGASPAHS